MTELLGYARVSTEAQSAALQEDALRAAGCSRIWTEVASGARPARPQLEDLLSYARTDDVICVWRIDRLSRGGVRATFELIEDRILRKGIHLRSLQEGVDTTNPTGKLIFDILVSILASLAAWEREALVARTKAGLESARLAGRVGGRPAALSDDQIRLARKLIAEGKTVRQTAALVGGVSRRTIYRSIARLEEKERAEKAARAGTASSTPDETAAEVA